MHIKTFFDAWQKLIINDMTGNFNYMDEYQSNFSVHTRSTLSAKTAQQPKAIDSTPETGGDAKSFPQNLSNMIKDATRAFNDMTGVPNPPETDPKKFPSSLTIILLPIPNGDEPHVWTTVANETFLLFFIQLSASSNIFFSGKLLIFQIFF